MNETNDSLLAKMARTKQLLDEWMKHTSENGWSIINKHTPPLETSIRTLEQWTTTFEAPYHQSFSNESMYADPATAPAWSRQGQTWNLTTPDGKVVFSEVVK